MGNATAECSLGGSADLRTPLTAIIGCIDTDVIDAAGIAYSSTGIVPVSSSDRAATRAPFVPTSTS